MVILFSEIETLLAAPSLWVGALLKGSGVCELVQAEIFSKPEHERDDDSP